MKIAVESTEGFEVSVDDSGEPYHVTVGNEVIGRLLGVEGRHILVEPLGEQMTKNSPYLAIIRYNEELDEWIVDEDSRHIFEPGSRVQEATIVALRPLATEEGKRCL